MSSWRGYVRGGFGRPFFCCERVRPCYKPAARGIAAGQDAIAGVAELVDALDLGSSDESCGGSSPSARTKRCSGVCPSFYRRTRSLAKRKRGMPSHRRKAPCRASSTIDEGAFGSQGSGPKRKKIDAMQVTETLSEGLKHEFQIS